MDATAWVAIAGIGGTLLAAVLSPLVTELMRRGSTRREQITDRAIDAYADLLTVTARRVDNAVMWARHPTAELLRATDDEEFDRLFGRVRVVAGEGVRKELDKFDTVAHRFNSLLGDARGYLEYRGAEPRSPFDQAAREFRTVLGEQAAEMVKVHRQIEAAIRKELRR